MASSKERLIPEGWPLKFIPGFILLFLVGFVGIYFSVLVNMGLDKIVTGGKHMFHYFLGAIVLGMIFVNVFGLPKWAEKGVGLYKFFLYAGIVALGGRLSLQVVIGKAPIIIFVVISKVAFTIALASWLASKLGIPDRFGTVLVTGVTICGVSAAAGVAGAINATDVELGYTVAAILLWGAFTLFVLPYIGLALDLNPAAFGIWCGLAMHNTAEVVAAAAIYTGFQQGAMVGGMNALDYAAITKMARNALMGLVILYFAVMHARIGLGGRAIKHKARFLWDKFPKFCVGFFIVMAMASIGLVPAKISDDNKHYKEAAKMYKKQAVVQEKAGNIEEAKMFKARSKEMKAKSKETAWAAKMVHSTKSIYKWFFLFTFAGIGLKTRFSEMKKAGFKPALMYILAKFMIASKTLLVMYMIFQYPH